MVKHRIIAALTACLTCAASLSLLPQSVPVRACEAVRNDFETSYNGWYGNADYVILTAQEGTGFQSAKAMQVSGRRSASDGAASAKGLYLSGGTEYDYSVMVYSDTAEEFSLSLLYIDEETGVETTKILASASVNAGTWTELSASFEAPEDTYEYLLTLTTDSVSDFRFDDVRITSDQPVNSVSAASADKGLKDAFAGYFRFGSTLNNETVKNSQLTAMVLREYNSITCGNQMKPDYMMVQSESKNNNVSISLKSCAAIMDFCVQNNIGMRGHTLVWHAQTPSWFFKQDFRSDGGWVDEKTMDIRLENYIRNVFAAIEEQYPTLDLYAYDVCNECVANSQELFTNNNGIREPGDNKVESGKSAWVQIYGDNRYVEKAFTLARKYAPSDCDLYYNDYNEYWDGKRDRIYELCKPLYEKGVLDGIGMQSHISANATGFGGTDSYIKAMKKFLSIGCNVEITELDVSIEKGKYTLEDQAEKYRSIVQAAVDWNKNPQSAGRVDAVCVWGLYDTLSWIGAENKPLLFDDNVQPKPAYYSLMGIIPESEWGEGNPGADADIAPDENGWYFHSTFEEDADQWTARGEAAVQISGRKPYQGGDALLVEGRTSAWHGASLSLDARAFKPGNAYSFSVHALYFDGDATDQFYLKLQYTSGNGDTKYTTIAQGMGFKGEWFQLANTSYRIPEDASDLRIYVETAKSTNNFYLDEAVGAVDGTVIKGAGEAEPIIYGDLDQDGRITAFDMALVKRGLLGEFASVRASASADVDRNGAVEVRDAVLIQKFLFGKIQSFTSET